jgi:general secretion pathway protein D
MVEATLRKLDLVPLQVLIEATIAEVTLRDQLQYGLQWFFSEGNHSGSLVDVTGASIPTQVLPGFSYLFAATNARVVLNALDSITDVNVISSPSLLVLDNETATLVVGDTVPIRTEEAATDTGIVSSFQQLETGIRLTVTPRVNAGGLVILEIVQEVSDAIATTTSGIDSPTIQQRRIETTVAIQSGETIALGGLIKDSKSKGKSGLPILHNLPIIGALFGETSADKLRTELLVVLTPTVVRGVQEAREVTKELRRRMRSVSPLDQRIR